MSETNPTPTPAAVVQQVNNGLGNGWPKTIANLTAVGAIMVFAYMMLTQVLDSANSAQSLLREGQKEQGQKLGDMVDELRDVKRVSRENGKQLKDAATATQEAAKSLQDTVKELKKLGVDRMPVPAQPAPPDKGKG